MSKRFNQTDAVMRAIADAVDGALNGAQRPKKIGFVLLVMPFDQPLGARTNYISNAERKDVIAAIKEVTARFEGQPELTGRA